jgi:hypothetical protein
VATGLILLGFIGIIVVVITHKVRRRLGQGTAPKTWLAILAVFAVLMLSLWAANTH